MTERHFHSKSHGRIHIDETGLRPVLTEADKIRIKIKVEQDFIRNNPGLLEACEEAQENIVFLQAELAALENYEKPDPILATESDQVQANLSADWDKINEIPF